MTLLLPALLISTFPSKSLAAGSTIPAFVIDVNNPSSFSISGSTVNSSITESANSASGTATGVTFENSTVTNSLVFGSGRYLTFANTVKPSLTNGVSIQFVAYLTTSSYNSTWPRFFDYGVTSNWGSGYDNVSIQLSDTGQLQFYMYSAASAGGYTCTASNPTVVANAFAMYSIQVGPSGVCSISVNGSSVTTSSTEATTTYASKVPGTSSTMNFRIGTMAFNVQSTLPSGKIRSFILSSGTTTTNSVTFMENGGTGYMPSQIASTSQALTTNTYTKSGYSFLGWNTKSDGTGTSYANGATFDFSSKSSMLFAQWGVIPPSLSVQDMTTATYRLSNPVVLTINTAGKYTFYDATKRISGCINLNGTPPSVTCYWRPRKIGATTVSATGIISSTNYYSNASSVSVVKRSTSR